MSYLSNTIGKITRRTKRTHAQHRPLAVAARRHAFIESAVEALENRQLLSAVHIANTSVTEGGSLVYNVTLNQPSNKAVSVNFGLVGGTAEQGVNYKPLKASTVTIPAGETSASVTVKTKADHVYADDKTLLARISNPTSGTTLKKATAKGKIVNTDPPPNIVIKNAAKTTEGDNGDKVLTFTVKMTGTTPSSPVQINYATKNITAKKNSDYVGARGTLTFDAAHKKQTINIVVRGDTVAEANEAFRIVYSVAKGSNATIVNNVVPGSTQAIGVIRNDDGGNVPTGTTISTFPAAVSVNPGGTAGVNIVLNRVAADFLAVNYTTSNGSATAGSDYTPVSGTAYFYIGQTSQTISIPTSASASPGDFHFTISTASDRATIDNATSTVNITNAPLPSLSVSTISVAEGNSGTKNATFTVALTAAATQPITVGYATADGSATAGSDYTATSGTLTFAPGETSKTVTVAVLGDTRAEGNETFSLVLGAPVNAPIAVGTGTATILDDDGALTTGTGVSFGSATGFNFRRNQSTGDLRAESLTYDLHNSNSTAITNAQLQFFFVPDGTNLDNATPFATTSIGNIGAGQTATGTAVISGDPAPKGAGTYYYYARLIANGVVYPDAVSQSISFTS